VRRLAPLLTLVVALAACSGASSSGPPLSRAALVARVDAECLKLADASTDLQNAQNPSDEGPTVAKNLHAGASQLRAHAQAIGDLTPPASLDHELHRFVSLLEQYADGIDHLADDIHPHETYTQLLNRSTGPVNHLNSISDQANQIAATLAFNDCAT